MMGHVPRWLPPLLVSLAALLPTAAAGQGQIYWTNRSTTALEEPDIQGASSMAPVRK